MSRSARFAIVGLLTASSACALFEGFGDFTGGDQTDAAFDASLAETGGSSLDAESDAAVETYGDLADGSAWEFFNAARIAANFEGAAFDGRFAYFPSSSLTNTVLRYDTSQPFTAAAAWTTFDTLALNGAEKESFYGATFDGAYVYFVPQQTFTADGGAISYFAGQVIRFDTRQPPSSFAADAGTGAWSFFDTTTLPSPNGNPVGGFAGASYDGHYLYFIPTGGPLLDGGSLRDGLVARFDPTGGDGGIANAAQWSVFDTATVDPLAVGYAGGLFDGHYLYLVPSRTPTNQANGLAVRFDVTAPFEDAAAWSTENLIANVSSSAAGFATGAFDGRYIYFAPNLNTRVARFDTQGNTFTDAGSWSTYDLYGLLGATLNDASAVGHLTDTAFDGRYVIFSSRANAAVVRYDTQSAFTDSSAWSAIDVKTASLNSSVNMGATTFGSAVFDGQYLYLAPSLSTPSYSVFARFQAKSPPAQPMLPAYYGSTF